MGPLALLAIFAGLAASAAIISDDDNEPLDDIDPDDEFEEPEVVLDTGATFAETESGVEIELGEDETGSLSVFHFTDTQDDQYDFVKIEEARFYLVPEGVDWSDASWETQNIVPGLDGFLDVEGNRESDYSLEEFETFFDLELLGVVDLKDAEDDEIDIVSNAPVDSYIVEAVTDGDYLQSFLPGDYVVTKNGVPETPVFEDTTGTSGTDWFSADADGLTVSGAGGDDFLETHNSDVTLIGGGGDDDISAYGDNAILRGGNGDDYIFAGGENALLRGSDGDDQLSISSETVYGGLPGDDPVIYEGSGTAFGGDGDDYLTGRGVTEIVLYGDLGNDYVIASGDSVEGYGGDGDDFLVASSGAIVFGEAGDDHLQLASGTAGDAGDGDDLISVWQRLHDEDGRTDITTGDGADTVDVIVRNPFGGEADDVFLQITDFDPEEDVLQVGTWGSDNDVDDIEIVEADDGSYSDVRITYEWVTSLSPGIAVIRLDGVTGLTEDQIVVAS